MTKSLNRRLTAITKQRGSASGLLDPRRGLRPLDPDPAKPPAVGGSAPKPTKPPKLPIVEIFQNLTTGHLRFTRGAYTYSQTVQQLSAARYATFHVTSRRVKFVKMKFQIAIAMAARSPVWEAGRLENLSRCPRVFPVPHKMKIRSAISRSGRAAPAAQSERQTKLRPHQRDGLMLTKHTRSERAKSCNPLGGIEI